MGYVPDWRGKGNSMFTTTVPLLLVHVCCTYTCSPYKAKRAWSISDSHEGLKKYAAHHNTWTCESCTGISSCILHPKRDEIVCEGKTMQIFTKRCLRRRQLSYAKASIPRKQGRFNILTNITQLSHLKLQIFSETLKKLPIPTCLLSFHSSIAVCECMHIDTRVSGLKLLRSGCLNLQGHSLL